MIISTSVDNLMMDFEALTLANTYGEKRSVFGRTCMDEFDGDTRLTFISPAKIELMPRQFVADLLLYCPDNVLPASLKIIDFMWSKVGEDPQAMTDPHKMLHFAREVAVILIKDYPELRVNVLTQVLNEPIFNEKDIRRMLDFNENFHFTTETLKDLPSLSKERREALVLVNNRIAQLKEELFKSVIHFEVTRMISHFFTLSLPESQANLRYQIDAFSRLAHALRNPTIDIKEVYSLMDDILRDPKLDNPKNDELKMKILEIFPVDSLIKSSNYK